jgi:proteic killer suppression protein
MQYDFGNKHLIELYTKGKSKKYNFIDRNLAKIFVARIDRIEAAAVITDLYFPPAMHFEGLDGHKDCFSVRINKKYRIEFRIDFTNSAGTVGDVLILDVTKHYE